MCAQKTFNFASLLTQKQFKTTHLLTRLYFFIIFDVKFMTYHSKNEKV
ncbi:hypothetical protein M23134_05251 [Microscilla marina ATCC 23134]|uniref:Uncharacterized protein n=1 Tax=Microscilla marina ATCC 23134 TaxID=313606 RepID=A1ZDK6_MICM2|nr:hypothetical protein M23134_05251 [Microscilla marina ATCC 23134]